jgi:Holliday junction resolvase
MATTPEAKVKSQVRKMLDAADVYYFSPAANGYGRVGIPDIICCYRGLFIAIECKAGKGKTTTLQDREITNIRNRGGVALVINEDNYDDVTDALTALDGLDCGAY